MTKFNKKKQETRFVIEYMILNHMKYGLMIMQKSINITTENIDH